MTMGHAIHWKPRILEKEKNNAKRKVLEALTIGQVKDAVMNHDNGVDLGKLWLDLM